MQPFFSEIIFRYSEKCNNPAPPIKCQVTMTYSNINLFKINETVKNQIKSDISTGATIWNLCQNNFFLQSVKK